MFNIYIIKKIIIKSFYITAVLTGLFWLISSVRFMDIIIHRKNGLIDFCYLMLLNSVEIVITLLPISLAIAVLSVLFNMQRERELIALRSIGFSLLDVVKPIAISGLIVTVFVYVLNIYIKPVSISSYRDKLHEIENSFSSSLIRQGEFIKINDSTIYVSQREAGGVLKGVIVNVREKGIENTYYAKHAIVSVDKNTGFLNIIMKDGIRRWVDKKSGIITVLSFDVLSTPIKHNDALAKRYIKVGELSLYQLITKHKNGKKEMAGKKFDISLEQQNIEFYNRLILPMLALIFAISCACIFLYMRVKLHKSTNKSIFMAFIFVVIMQALIQYLANNLAKYGLTIFPVFLSLMLVVILPFIMLVRDKADMVRHVMEKEGGAYHAK